MGTACIGTVTLPEDKELVMPGEDVSLTVELSSPINMGVGSSFSMMEGGRIVGTGVVSNVIE